MSKIFKIFIIFLTNFRNKKQKSFTEALDLLKDKTILSVGLIECFYFSVLGIYIFSWTPLLQKSTSYEVNVGLIYFLFVIFSLLGASFYEIFLIILRTNYVKLMLFAMMLEISMFSLIFFVQDFTLRLMFLSIINVIKFLNKIYRELKHFLCP